MKAQELRGAFRGESAPDINALVKTLVGLSRIGLEMPDPVDLAVVTVPADKILAPIPEQWHPVIKVFMAACRQAGIVQAKNPMELLDISTAFSSLPLPKGNNVALLTLGGRWGVVASDLCEESG